MTTEYITEKSEKTFGGWMTSVALADGRQVRYGRSKSPLRRGFFGYFVYVDGENERRWSCHADGGGADKKMAGFLARRFGISIVRP